MKKSATKANRIRSITEIGEHSEALRIIQKEWPDVKTVEDSKSEMMLTIRQSDIDDADPGNPAHCAVAVNLTKNYPDVRGALIGRVFAFLVYGTHIIRYQLGKSAQVRTAMFDDRGTMSRGPVMLSKVSPANRLGHIQARTMRSNHAMKHRKSVSPSTKSRRQTEDALRQHIVTQGFRTWNRSRFINPKP